MKLEGKGKLLRIFIGEDDHLDKKPLYHVFVERAREFGMAGATVLRGVESFGAGSMIHTAKLLELSEDLPLVIELVDSEEKVDAFLPIVEGIFEKAGCGGMITEEKVNVIHYTHGKEE
jgi:PII-like signaling protein